MPFDGPKVEPAPMVRSETVVLLQARCMIASPRRWTKGRSHRWGLFGRRYCMAGAVDRACEKFDLGVTLADANVFLRAAARKRGFDDGAVLNDHPDTTHGDVLALLEEAAALSQKRSG